MPNDSVNQFKKRLIAELKRDKKRTGILALLTVVAVVMGVRLLAKSGGDVPPPASAAVAQASAEEGESQADAAAPAPREQPLATLRGTRVTRDLFRVDPMLYPIQIITAQGSTTKPVADEAELRRQQEQARISGIRSQAAGLLVDGTIVSGEPTAMINGQVCKLGSVIEGFRIEEITSRGCVVQKDGVRVSIEKK
jgi:hypothetical protein